MGKQRRKFEAGFKQQIVQEVESELLSVSADSRLRVDVRPPYHRILSARKMGIRGQSVF